MTLLRLTLLTRPVLLRLPDLHQPQRPQLLLHLLRLRLLARLRPDLLILVITKLLRLHYLPQLKYLHRVLQPRLDLLHLLNPLLELPVPLRQTQLLVLHVRPLRSFRPALLHLLRLRGLPELHDLHHLPREPLCLAHLLLPQPSLPRLRHYLLVLHNLPGHLLRLQLNLPCPPRLILDLLRLPLNLLIQRWPPTSVRQLTVSKMF